MPAIQRVHTIAVIAATLVVSAAAFADGVIPASLIRIPESVTTVFIAETSKAQFHRFEHSSDGIVHSGSFYMSIGQNGIGKKRSGDKRTPLGAYFVTERLDTTKLHEKYGVIAFPVDYPNAWDRLAGREGDGIWVHGVDPEGGQRPPLDTDGCIALPNEDLLVLAAEFRDNVTPILLMRVVDWVGESINRELSAELEQRIMEWADSKSNGDQHTYLSLYDEEFRRWGMNKSEWSSFTVQTQSLRAFQQVTFSDLLLARYPEVEGVYLSRFQLKVVENERETTATRRLYWRRDTSGVLKIIAEDDG